MFLETLSSAVISRQDRRLGCVIAVTVVFLVYVLPTFFCTCLPFFWFHVFVTLIFGVWGNREEALNYASLAWELAFAP
ncbi:hypothetical protein M440DRAFT_204503 [Trichoderma longibrachiatum ATCC 18648]|uniref:Uncharacterized protein n=1 Tax=Trichoderma longibrachiatum ATCC 18648 TaxID=983965 RepID=A0A2T4CGW1_TRILO|nr:hypothetical protein M440DRAFT_204503 [Trichoderma longibrachiatum ATCC 18648]